MAEYTINDSMAEMYLYETNSLLEQLDQILLVAEKRNAFDDEEINPIFRIMHTIKGSSAMMEFDKIARVSHLIEDLFAYIRTNGIDAAHNEALCNLVFQANDFLRAEVEKVENGDELNDDIAFLENGINNFLSILKGIAAAEESASLEAVQSETAAPAAAQEDAQAPDQINAAVENELTAVVFFDEDCQMENVRAMLLLNKIRGICSEVMSDPQELANNDDAAQQIISQGFKITLPAACSRNSLEQILQDFTTVDHYTINGQPGGKKLNDDEPCMLRVFFEDDIQMENMRAYMLLNQVREIYPEIQSIPDQLEDNPEAAQQIIHEGFVLIIGDGSKFKEVMGVIEQGYHIKSYATEPLNHNELNSNELELHEESIQPTMTKETPISVQKNDEKMETPVANEPKSVEADSAAKGNDGTHKAVKQSLISVNLNRLDVLMNVVGEIVITESMVTASPELQGLELDNFTKSARQLRKLTDELQDIAMSIRMVPVAGAFQKMHRIVRDMNKKLDKNVELVLIGEETEVDKTVVDGIGDPLMHLVRNSMDHGIESREDRIRAGKDPDGKIILSAQNTGGEIVISVQDDGKGLDPEVLLQKASERGLLTKKPSEYTEREIYNLLMLPGFSTKEQVTEFSGRGVGMDVVKKNIERIGGTINIESKKGQGTATIFKIPLTLAIMDAMQIAVGSEILTIPINVIRQSFKIKKEDIVEDVNGNPMVNIRGVCYSILKLYQIYDLETEVMDLEEGILIQVETDGHAACIFADKLLGQHQIVVKPLPSYFNVYDVRSYGITGCTILGDGGISLILEVSSLLK